MSSRHEEFDSLVRRYSRLVARAIRRVCSRRYGSLVPDIEQEVYAALWNRLGRGKEIEHPASYLYRMALTTALAQIRKDVPSLSSIEDAPTAVEAIPNGATGCSRLSGGGGSRPQAMNIASP